ncbi:MAG TPA: class I SAM-dependent methyltransferase [Candidatus Tectomicrobia bacterium]
MAGELAYRRETCRLCEGRDLELALPLTPTPLADSYITSRYLGKVQKVYPLDLYLCRDCGHVQLLQVVHPEAIYYDYIYETKSSLGLVDHFRGYAEEVIGRIKPPNGAFVVDLGSNDGTLLRFFKQKGMRVLGIDPAREIARTATDSGIETLPQLYTRELASQIRKERGAAAIVTANNLFANVDELASFTEAIRDLLAPDGVFVFESFYLVDWLQNMVFDFAYHEHLSYFSAKPLVAFFRHHGMELIDVLRIPTKGGSVRYTIQRAGGKRPVSWSVSELTALETRIGSDRIETFRAFARKIDDARERLSRFLQNIKKEGKTIAGYGASATTTTLVYHFQLGQWIQFMVDDYPAKQNLFSPGFHIPVLAPQMIYERKPDYVLILAWRYFEPILKKHEAFLKQGGHFIVPLPELKIF